MAVEALLCDKEEGRCVVRLLFYVLNIRTPITMILLAGFRNEVMCRQLIDTFFFVISESPLAFPYLEYIMFGYMPREEKKEVVPYLEERFKQVRELGGLIRLRSLVLNNVNILTGKWA